MAAYSTSMPTGIPGGVSRRAEATLEPVKLSAETPFGTPLALTAGAAGAAVTAASVVSFLARAFQTGAGTGGNSASAGSIQDQLRRGYMSVRLSGAEATAAVRGGSVKLIEADAGEYVTGELAVSAGVAIPGATFMGPQDSDGTVEIAFNI
ncbi:hypothetical protein [Rhodospirillum sp. A1_3_36]|uniref:structural cement protein Gp24 n=1 Tax=Rhodospirillum sp. A1_3_36 TaxID=3391666 RepID=UPI0039A6C17F